MFGIIYNNMSTCRLSTNTPSPWKSLSVEITISPWVCVLIVPSKSVQIVALGAAVFSHWRGAVDLCYIKDVVGDAIPRFREMGSHKDRTHSGWPPCFTPVQDWFLSLIAHKNQFRTALSLKGQWQHALGRDVPTSTIKLSYISYHEFQYKYQRRKVIFVICWRFLEP